MKKKLNLTLKNLQKMQVIDDSFELIAFEHITMDPAYVHINTENSLQIKNVMQELQTNNIYSIGRYGGWTYCSMEDCMVEAKSLSSNL